MAHSSRWQPDWLRGYATEFYGWQTCEVSGETKYWRRIGLVESLFDMDGTGYEGRADLNMTLLIELRTSLDLPAFRRRICQSWSVMRQRHILLSARAIQLRDIDYSSERGQDRVFVFTPSSSVEALFESGNASLNFMDDTYPEANQDEFYLHLMNTGRAIDSSKAGSRLLVMPLKHSTRSTFNIRFVLVAGHQVADGLTTFRWMNSFIYLLNLTEHQLQSLAQSLVDSAPSNRLPPAQESLYPPVQGSPARRRWFWLISRILRHTAKTHPASFQNPLRRSMPLSKPTVFEPKYPALLNYSAKPTNNAYTVNATLSPHASHRLISLCRQSSISIGSGLFTLVALTMMQLHERSHPSSNLPFTGSFPLNPRHFLSGPPTTGHEDSLMLAFSDGITLPFLPSNLPLEPRFKFLARQAHRQLRSYQKRSRNINEELALGAKSSKFLLPTFYLSTLERYAQRMHFTGSSEIIDAESNVYNFQGEYEPATPSSMATCGISSIGDRTSLISRGKYSLEWEDMQKEGKDLAVDFRNMWTFVRPRDGEFLVGAAGNTDTVDGRTQLGFGVSYDGNTIDPVKVREWKRVIEGLLEEDDMVDDEGTQDGLVGEGIRGKREAKI